PVGSFTITVNGSRFSAGSFVSFDGSMLPTTFVSTTKLTATGTAASAKASVPVLVYASDGQASNTTYVAVTAAPAVSVSVTPASASVRISRTRLFVATVQNTTNTSVTWKVNGIAGGNSTVGTINTFGNYRAPSSVPTPAVVTVSATLVADPSTSASASVTLTRR
ncbi:MAG: hypothetical protein ABI211_05575, partial [Vicinamibacterales bacterium]